MKSLPVRMIACAFVATMALTSFASGAKAQDKSVVIGFDAANPPFMFDQGGEAKGLYPVLVSEVFKKMGVSVQEKAEPWSRVLANVDAGTSGVGGVYKNPEREKKYDFSAPIFQERLVLYTNTAKPVTFSKLEDLAGKSVGVLRGWSYGDAFDKERAAGKIVVEEVDSDETNIKKLSMGRIDALIAVPQGADKIIADQKLEGKIVALPTPVSTNDTYVAFAKKAGQTALIKKIDDTIAAMKADGSYDTLVKGAMK